MTKASKPQPRRTYPEDGPSPANSDAALSIPLRRRVRRAEMDKEHYDDLLRDLYDLARFGATDQEVAETFGVTKALVAQWRRADPRINEVMQLGKEAANARVRDALYHRAIGYTYEVEKVLVTEGKVVRYTVKEHVPPDVKAAEIWLFNRDPDNWRPRNAPQVALVVDAADVDKRKMALAMLTAMHEAANARTIEHDDHDEYSGTDVPVDESAS